MTPRLGGIPLGLFVLTGRSSVETVRRSGLVMRDERSSAGRSSVGIVRHSGLVTRDGRSSVGRRSVGIVRLDWAAFVGTKGSMG